MTELISLPAAHEYLRPFQALCSVPEGRDAAPPAGALRNIVGLGAVWRDEFGLVSRDQYWFAHALRFCREKSIPVAKDFRLTPFDNMRGADFLDPAINVSTDMLLCCLVINPELPRGWLQSRLHPAQISGFGSNYRRKAKESGAKLIAVFSDSSAELRSENFMSPDFLLVASKVISAPTQIQIGCAEPFRPPEPDSVNFHKAYAMEILVHRGFVEELSRAGSLLQPGLK